MLFNLIFSWFFHELFKLLLTWVNSNALSRLKLLMSYPRNCAGRPRAKKEDVRFSATRRWSNRAAHTFASNTLLSCFSGVICAANEICILAIATLMGCLWFFSLKKKRKKKREKASIKYLRVVTHRDCCKTIVP